MSKNLLIQLEIKNKLRALKQLEGVCKTTTDKIQRKRVSKEIEGMKKSIEWLRWKLNGREEANETQEMTSSEAEGEYSILNTVPVTKYREESKDREMDAVISYMDFFERNYLPILSEYYIKLDFSHSTKMDIFYPLFIDIKKILDEYGYELEVQSRKEFTRIAVLRDRSIFNKIRQRYYVELNKFFKDLRDFLKVLIDDHMSGGNIILNPYGRILLSEFEENRKLDNYYVKDALEEMYRFSEEFMRFLSIPDLSMRDNNG